MEDPCDYTVTVREDSEKAYGMINGRNAWKDEPSITNHPPARPSSHRARGPRTENLASRKRRHSSEVDNGGCERSKGSELVILQQKITESDRAKAQAQEQLKRQDVEIAKLERYINQLVEERGGRDKNMMESIIRDLEKSALVKRTQKQFADLKGELRRKEQHIASLKAIQNSNHVLNPAEANEPLTDKDERIIAQSNQQATEAGYGQVPRSSHNTANCTKPQLAELERLRAQNYSMRAEIAGLHSELHAVNSRDRKSETYSGEIRDSRDFSAEGGIDKSSGSRDPRNSAANNEVGNQMINTKGRRDSTSGPLFHEGQAVECQTVGLGAWRSAVVDSVRLCIDTMGGSSGRRSKAYTYTVWLDKGGSESGVPEARIRLAKGDDLGSGTSPSIVHRGSKTIIRAKIFRSGETILARDGESKGKWIRAEVIRRNEDGTYCVVFDGSVGEQNLHSAMLRSTDDLEQNAASGGGNAIDADDDNQREQDKSGVASAGEEAELRYEEKREILLAAARDAFLDIVEVGRGVLARYPGKDTWGAGTVVGQGKDELHLSVDFDSGDFVENLPFIFVRPRLAGNILSDQGHVNPGDAVLAQKDDTLSSGDWCPARFKRYEKGGNCSLVFAGEAATTTTRRGRAQLLYGGTKKCDPPEIPDVPPLPTKPVRAKKHRVGDIVMACIPKIRAWMPALVRMSKGRGRYSVEWADGEKVDSLLFMFIATLGSRTKENVPTTIIERQPLCQNRLAGSSNVRRDEGTFEGNGATGEVQNALVAQSCGEDGIDGETAKVTKTYVRLRQPQLKVGEPVLAKTLKDSVWAPGAINKVLGDSKYDIIFTDGSTVEGLSFLFIRALDLGTLSDSGDDSEEIAGPGRDYYKVGDTVYVLKRGQSLENIPLNTRNRDLWRAGVVGRVSNGRYTVVYDGEEGKPQESRIHVERVRPRQRIRQKVMENNDTVLALSKKPGRGWMMGTIAGRTGKGTYNIAFSDGSEEDDIRFANLRRVESNGKEEDKHHRTDKPAMRAIRQRRFRVGKFVLARHPESRKWGVVQVLEALSDGRYDLKLAGGEGSVFKGVSFQSMRHLDIAQVLADNPLPAGCKSRGVGEDQSQPLDNGPDTGDRTLSQSISAGIWVEQDANHCSVTDTVDDARKSIFHMKTDNVPTPVVKAGLDIGSNVYVLRRGKSADVDVKDTSAWRSGKIIFIRDNGALAVEYDEPGNPKEDRVADYRVRPRIVLDHCDSVRRAENNTHDCLPETFVEGDIVVTRAEGSDEVSLAAVNASLGLSMHRVSFLDGSGTTELESHQLSHLTNISQVGRALSTGGKGIVIKKNASKMRKLRLGELVLAQKDCKTWKNQPWFAAIVLEAAGGGMYSLRFEGDEDPTRVHLTKIRPLKTSDEGGKETSGVSRSSDATTGSSNRVKRCGDISGRGRAGGEALVLRVSEASFNLSTAPSTARHTQPHLILAAGERGGRGEAWDAPWLHADAVEAGSARDQESFVVRGRARPGSRNPTWTDKKGDVFFLSLEGLEEPALFLCLEDGGAKTSTTNRPDRGGGGRVSEEAILAVGCIPVPLDKALAKGIWANVTLENGAGTARLRLRTHEASEKRT